MAKRKPQRVPPRSRRKRGGDARILEAASAVAEVVPPEALDATRRALALREYMAQKLRMGHLNRAARQAVTLEWVQQTGQTPLEFLIEQMRNKRNSKAFRAHCAGEALPYVHRKMPGMLELEQIDPEGQLTEAALRSLSDEELQQLIDITGRAAGRLIEHKP